MIKFKYREKSAIAKIVDYKKRLVFKMVENEGVLALVSQTL
jgi:hypothetical protein